MKIIRKLFVIALMSVITNGVAAQTSKTKDIAHLTSEDSIVIANKLIKQKKLWQEDSIMVVDLLKQKNTPIKGVIVEDQDIIPKSRKGDEWIAYISEDRYSFWLTYAIYRKEKFIGNISTRLD